MATSPLPLFGPSPHRSFLEPLLERCLSAPALRVWPQDPRVARPTAAAWQRLHFGGPLRPRQPIAGAGEG